MITRDPANFRELAASLACFILIMSAVGLMFALLIIPIFTEKPVTLAESAAQFYFGLVMGALGYLIGKQTVGPVQPSISVPVPEGSSVRQSSTTEVKNA
jgi:hypothetical protein